MTLAYFIDVFLTPTAAGLGMFIAATSMSRRDPDKNAILVPLKTRLGMAAAVAAAMFAYNILL